MSNPLNALQAAIFSRLTGYSPLTTALGGSFVYDHVPANTNAPYVTIGDVTLVEQDTKTRNGWEATITINCWDFEKAGRKTINTLMGHIYDALHNQQGAISITGFTLVLLRCEFQQPFQESAVIGESDHFYHGVQRFRAFIHVN